MWVSGSLAEADELHTSVKMENTCMLKPMRTSLYGCSYIREDVMKTPTRLLSIYFWLQ